MAGGGYGTVGMDDGFTRTELVDLGAQILELRLEFIFAVDLRLDKGFQFRDFAVQL
jgi:hypothetical protein